MKLVAFSDVHADAATAGLDRYEDIEAACGEVVRAAVRERADLVLFLGDLTDPDTSRSHRAVALMASVASELRREGIEWRGIAGNHDVVEDGTGSTTLSSLKAAGFACFEQPAVERFAIDGPTDLELVYLPYPPRSRTHDPEAFVREEATVLLSSMRGEVHDRTSCPIVVAGHLMIRGADPGSESADLARGRDVFWPVDAIREVFGKNALLLGGHYHGRQVAAGGIQIVGSLARLRFDEETHTPGYLVCETRPRGGWDVRFERVTARPLWTVGPRDDLWIVGRKRMPDNAPGAIVRVRPPAEASDEAVEELKVRIERSGAAKVHVEPRAPAAAVVAPEAERPRARQQPREVVMGMAEEARTEDRPALVGALDRELTAQKL